MKLKRMTIAALATALIALPAALAAEEMTIVVWSGGTGANSNYRVDAIELAADLYSREQAILGNDITINVEKEIYSDWEPFKQAFTLAAEAGTAPHIAVTGHEDDLLLPWKQEQIGVTVAVEVAHLNVDERPGEGDS